MYYLKNEWCTLSHSGAECTVVSESEELLNPSRTWREAVSSLVIAERVLISGVTGYTFERVLDERTENSISLRRMERTGEGLFDYKEHRLRISVVRG